MPTPPMPRALAQAAVDAVRAAGGNRTRAQRALGISNGGLYTRLRAAVRYGIIPTLDALDAPAVAPCDADQSDAPTPAEARRVDADVAFLRAQNREMARALERAERLVHELGGVRDVPLTPPAWMTPSTKGAPHGRAVLGVLWSDWHAGEVVRADEIEGLNRYDVEVFRARIRRYVAAVVEIGPRWMADCQCVGAFVALAGDLISGDIHEELRITNALTAHEQVRVVVEELVAALRVLADTFGRVLVVSVPGNHGRTTPKPTAKLYSRLSYDTLIADMARDRLADDERIDWNISAGTDVLVPVLGWNVLVTHGDKMGTGGGQGFAGPFLPIVRGQKKIEIQQFRARRSFDLLLSGHYHVSGQPGPHLTNGSVPGYTEFGHAIRAAVEPPQQWAFVLHERWMLRDRAEIRLEDPIPPPKPRVRVPAVMA